MSETNNGYRKGYVLWNAVSFGLEIRFSDKKITRAGKFMGEV